MKWFNVFLLLLFTCFKLKAQQPVKYNYFVDSLINWINTHPKIDSQYIHTLHRISYNLSELDTKESFDYYVKVASLSDSLNFIYGKALAQINLGLLLMSADNFEASNAAFLKALDEADSCHSLLLKAVSYNDICLNFVSLGNYSSSIKYINLALAADKNINSTLAIAINIELLAICDFESGKFSKAYVELLTGLSFAQKLNSISILNRYYLDFGKVAAANNKTDSANYFFSKVIREAKAVNDYENEYFVYIAQVRYLKNLTTVKKKLLLDSALYFARLSLRIDRISNAAKQLSSIYNTLKNKDSSEYYYQIYITNTDSIYNRMNILNVMIEQSDWIINRNSVATRNYENRVKMQRQEIAKKNQLLLAIIISILLGGITIIFIYKTVQSKKKQQELILQQKIAEAEALSLRSQVEQLVELQQIRTQISSDLHDDIGSSLSSIMIMTEMAKIRQDETGNYFDKIKENAGTIIENMNDIVWAVNPSNDTIEQLFIRMQSYASSLLEKKDIKFQFTSENNLSLVKLNMEERKNFYLVFKEAIHNAFKYSNCNEVTAKISQQEKAIVMVINDDGKGFDAAKKYTGNGLNNMKKRAEQIKGKLEIISSYDNGTHLTLAFKPTQKGS